MKKISKANVDLLKILNQLIEKHSYQYIADELNIAIGTVKRWKGLKNIPKSYTFQLMKLANIKINYSTYNFKEKDQFFTPVETSKYCFDNVLEILKKMDDNSNYTYIEPSAGSGNFLKHLPQDKRIGLDIEPRGEEIIQCDFLEWKPPEKRNYIVIGNPPFGLRGQLALKFINHSSNINARYVCFILPQLFLSDGKGVPRKRVRGYNLIHSEKLKTDFTDPDDKNIKVECIFQIWSKEHHNEKYDIKTIDETIMKIYSLSDGGTPSTTRNKKMFNKCHIYLPSTCFGKNNMNYYDNFEDLPNHKGYGIVFQKNKEENIRKFRKIEWSNIAFLSTNSAYNIRTSQIAAAIS
jgi:hypothetical protein